MDDQGQLLDEEGWFRRIVQFIREDETYTTELDEGGHQNYIQNMSDEDWEELGLDISNNTHLEKVKLYNEALSDDRMSYLFGGMTRSSSIKEMHLYNNDLSIAAVRSMLPFLQNANNLTRLNLDDNDLQCEGFNFLLRALRNCPIERLDCYNCGIASIEIDNEHKPKRLKQLYLDYNNIDTDGCRELTKLLQGGDATLKELHLDNNDIDDDGVEILMNALQTNSTLTELHLDKNDISDYGVEILVDSLRSNKSLKTLSLKGNNEISNRGQLMLLKLVGDVSSIEATLQCNHTLNSITVETSDEDARVMSEAIEAAADSTSYVYRNGSLEREKIMGTQLNSATREELAELQGVNHSVFSEIDPLHMPEVLALVGNYHGQEELYVALRSSIAGLISTVDRKQYLKQQWEYHKLMIAEHEAKMDAIEAELATMEVSGVAPVENIGSETRRDKKRRTL